MWWENCFSKPVVKLLEVEEGYVSEKWNLISCSVRGLLSGIFQLKRNNPSICCDWGKKAIADFLKGALCWFPALSGIVPVMLNEGLGISLCEGFKMLFDFSQRHPTQSGSGVETGDCKWRVGGQATKDSNYHPPSAWTAWWMTLGRSDRDGCFTLPHPRPHLPACVLHSLNTWLSRTLWEAGIAAGSWLRHAGFSRIHITSFSSVSAVGGGGDIMRHVQQAEIEHLCSSGDCTKSYNVLESNVAESDF